MTDDDQSPSDAIAPPEARREADGYSAPADYSGSSQSGVVRAHSQPGVSPAEWTYERLSRQIAAFEAKLKPDEEIGGRMTASPADGAFQIEDLGWWGPDMIIFYGKSPQGRPIQLIQHVTQLNVLLTATPKSTPADPPRRIGFELAKRLRDKVSVSALADEAEAQRPSAESKA